MKERLLQCLELLRAFEDKELEVPSGLSFGLSFAGDSDDVSTLTPDGTTAVTFGLQTYHETSDGEGVTIYHHLNLDRIPVGHA